MDNKYKHYFKHQISAAFITRRHLISESKFARKRIEKLFNLQINTYIIKLSYIFLAKQENSEAYTNIPAKTHVYLS